MVLHHSLSELSHVGLLRSSSPTRVFLMRVLIVIVDGGTRWSDIWCRRIVRQRSPVFTSVLRRMRTHAHRLRHCRPWTVGWRSAAVYGGKWPKTWPGRWTRREGRWRHQATFSLRQNNCAASTIVRFRLNCSVCRTHCTSIQRRMSWKQCFSRKTTDIGRHEPDPLQA